MVTGATQMDGAILVVAATDGLYVSNSWAILAGSGGVPKIVVFMNKVDPCGRSEMLELVEMEVRELLDKYQFDGNNASIIKGSALKALEGDPVGKQAIYDLMAAVDKDIPEPVRLIDQPFLMPVEDVFFHHWSRYSCNW